MLLESPGEIVSREEIRNRLWPDDTIVEFDHSINAAVKRLRDALRDSADKPRYIETLVRRGYRFIGELQTPEGPVRAPEPVAITSEEYTRQPLAGSLHRRLLLPGIAAAVIAIACAVLLVLHPQQPLQPLMRLDLDLGGDFPLA